MAVTLTLYEQEFVGDGATLSFPLPFAVLEEEHLLVSVTIGGGETFLTLGHDYTVSGEGAGEGACSVVCVTAPPSGSEVIIRRVVPINQLIDFRSQGNFSPDMWEYAADKLTMIAQQVNGGTIDVREILGGEINGGQNVNVDGVGVYDGKVGTTLQFRGIAAGSGKVIVTFDDASNEIRVDLGLVSSTDIRDGAGTVYSTLSTISATVTNHNSRISTLEGRTEAVSLRGEYKWNGSSYDLMDGAIDPHGVLPNSVSNFGGSTGRPQIIWSSTLPEGYRTAVLTSIATDGMTVFPCWLVKSDADLQLIFSSMDGEKNVEQFSLFVDYEGL